ncbi:MAG: 3-phosphoshikimate 1-carboxyvinyltransferase [Chloroflexota bacterium]|nr:3-phosphoshikimate 1-carboxyvinyltransferase [Chloroflexota bacterium]
MVREISSCLSLRGEISPPGDKSISHRVVMLNAIAEGRATITNLCPGDDCISTIRCLRALGADIHFDLDDPMKVTIHGTGSHGLSEPLDILDAGNSGTTMRLLAGLLAAQPIFSIITGDSSLRSRPMGRIVTPLRMMGANIAGRAQDTLPPLAIHGQKLQGITYKLPIASAQVKSAIILAALFSEGSTKIIEPVVSRDHTERLLQAMGATIHNKEDIISIDPLDKPLKAISGGIPSDLSAAAQWLVAGAIHPNSHIEMRGVGLNPTRTGIIEVLLQMGANLKTYNMRTEGGEPVADVVIESSQLRGARINGELIPRLIDEIPLLAVAASFAEGPTVISGAEELRHKESDRLATTAEELLKLGARIEELPDGMMIHGGTKLHGAKCSSHNDHRLAMAIGVAGLIAEGRTEVHQAEAVDISYPTFWQDMETLGGKMLQ